MGTLFEPHIALCLEPDGEYTLHAVTLTPNSNYAAGPARAEPPPNVRLAAEVQPVLLTLRHRGRRAPQVLKPVRHYLPNLKLGKTAGKTSLMVFVMMDQAVLGSASIDVSQLGRIEPGQGTAPPIDTSDWYAWLDRMPPGPASLHVTGQVTVPTPGFEASLTRAAPIEGKPEVLVLDLEVRRLPGTWIQVVTQIPVRYDDPQPTAAFREVLIRHPDGSEVRVDIEEVH